MILDRSRPYAEVIGLPGAKWEQDGHLFKPDGAPVLTTLAPIADGPDVEIEDPDLDAKVHTDLGDDTGPTSSANDLETMHWKRLKILAESFGVEWTNRQDVIAQIRGK